MGKKVFVSYKYGDTLVKPLERANISERTKVRHYVDELDDLLEDEDNIYKGEDDGEDLSSLQDSTIGSKLGDKIFDSTVTIVLISKGMKDKGIPEKDQWIPWEVSYSLRDQSREGRNSKTNAILGVVLPDENDSYEYYIMDDACPDCHCRTLSTYVLFQILSDNMFNIKKPVYTDCDKHSNSKPFKGFSSFIYSVKWDDFKYDINKYVDIALHIRANINDYQIVKSIK